MKVKQLFAKYSGTESNVEPDKVAKNLLRAASLDPAEADQIAENPALYARVRNQIEARNREDVGWGLWLDILRASRTAAPAMAIAAAVAGGGLIYSLQQRRSEPVNRAVHLQTPDPEPAVSACSIGAKQECAISRGDVLAIIIPGQEGTEK
ncbi:MAG TPA: hypothetical protein VFV34_28915 [Blastocatellia bacterium]|nr:hypothetical protein [Blastocatellia bacterium]